MNSANIGYYNVPDDQEGFLYSVLNVPSSASQNDIRERHRALSLIFHPDKQHDERTKDTAAKRFLEIQKAYEVLSDPFLRQVYDLFGEDGLNKKWPDHWRAKPPDELQALLRQSGRETRQKELENLIRHKGHFTCGVIASPIFGPYDSRLKWHRQIFSRLKEVWAPTLGVGNIIQTCLNDKTKLTLSADMASARSRDGKTNLAAGNVSGTIRHQYSPRWSYQATGSLVKPEDFSLKATYRDDDTVFTIDHRHKARLLRPFPPPLTIGLSRRLFRQSQTQGILVFDTTLPLVSIGLTSATPFDWTPESYLSEDNSANMASKPKLGSASGFGSGDRYWKYGVALAGISSSLTAEWGVTFSEIAVQAKFALELGFTGLSGMLTGSWASSQTEVSAGVGLNYRGVIMKLEFSYLGQRLLLPITMSEDADATLAFYTTVIPATAFLIGYHFVIKPRRRAQRVAYIRAAEKEHNEQKSITKRAAEETAYLLRDTARKHTQLEVSKGGLVITEATYGPTELGEEARNLSVDVTVAIQALVHNSQVYVPGHRTKSGIQGFYDPAPSVAKSLRVRYLFHDRPHYAEIPDYIPVVLPLADHLVQ